MELSFVIPAFNEERNLPRLISSIREYIRNEFEYEVIVIDNGSTDGTVAVAKEIADKILVDPVLNIGELRNLGASVSEGKVLVFLDADVRLTPKWIQTFKSIYEKVISTRGMFGSWVKIPENPSWIEKYWFGPLEKREFSHVNSAHMIIAKELFNELGGFDESLETGEDYDISVRAKKQGLIIYNEPELEVIHDGFPKTLSSFIIREYWHGIGDSVDIGRVIRSKVALVSILISLLTAIFFIGIVVQSSTVSMAALALLVLVLLLISSIRYKGERVGVILVNTFLFYFYFLSRFISLFSFFFKRTKPMK